MIIIHRNNKKTEYNNVCVYIKIYKHEKCQWTLKEMKPLEKKIIEPNPKKNSMNNLNMRLKFNQGTTEMIN